MALPSTTIHECPDLLPQSPISATFSPGHLLLKRTLLLLFGNSSMALAQWLQFAIIARHERPEVTGLYALALTISTPFALLFTFQTRVLLVTDTLKAHHYSDYFRLRVAGMGAAVLLSVLVSTFYGGPIIVLVFLLALQKASDGVSDIVYGLHQSHHVWARIFGSQIAKSITITILPIIGYAMSASLQKVLVYATAGSLLTTILLDVLPVRATLRNSRGATQYWSPMIALVRLGLSLGISAFLISFTMMIPRYAEEHFNGTKSLGVFVAVNQIGIAVMFIMIAFSQGMLPTLAGLFRTNRTAFEHTMNRVIAFSMFLGLVTIVCAFLGGQTFVAHLFGRDYVDDRLRFVMLMVASAMGLVTAGYHSGLHASRSFSQFLKPYAMIVLLCASASFLLPLWIKQMGPTIALLLTNAVALGWSVRAYRKVVNAQFI